MIDTVKDPSPALKNSDSIPVSVAARAIPDPANLVGRWHLNESTGTTAGDDSGSANNLTLNNMPASSWVSGQSGSALSFSGNNQDVSVASATHAIQTPSVTLLA